MSEGVVFGFDIYIYRLVINNNNNSTFVGRYGYIITYLYCITRRNHKIN